MIKTVLSWLTGGILDKLLSAFEASKNAETEQQRIQAEIDIATITAQTQRALAGGRIITWVQAAWAIVFFAYDAKLVLWDKVLGMGATDPLSPSLLANQTLIMTFLFGPPAIRKVFGR